MYVYRYTSPMVQRIGHETQPMGPLFPFRPNQLLGRHGIATNTGHHQGWNAWRKTGEVVGLDDPLGWVMLLTSFSLSPKTLYVYGGIYIPTFKVFTLRLNEI